MDIGWFYSSPDYQTVKYSTAKKDYTVRGKYRNNGQSRPNLMTFSNRKWRHNGRKLLHHRSRLPSNQLWFPINRINRSWHNGGWWMKILLVSYDGKRITLHLCQICWLVINLKRIFLKDVGSLVFLNQQFKTSCV